MSALAEGEIAEVKCGTSDGDVSIEFHRAWSPNGYDRAVELFEKGFYDDSHFYRTVPGFLVQFGISYTESEDLKSFAKRTIPDDPQLNPPIHFTTGTISYAGSGPNSRTSQLFFSLMKNGGGFGRELWETPVGKVVSGIEIVESFYSGYGDMPPWGKGPVQPRIHSEGRNYIDSEFPLLSHFNECKVKRFNSNKPPPLVVVAKEKADHHAKPLEHNAPKGVSNPKGNAKLHHDPPAIHNKLHDASTTKTHAQHHKPNDHAQQQGHPRTQQQALRRTKDQPHIPVDHHHSTEHVTGQLHHQHGVHLNTSQEEEGLTKLSWELLGGCVILFLGVFILWLRFALAMNRKDRKTS